IRLRCPPLRARCTLGDLRATARASEPACPGVISSPDVPRPATGRLGAEAPGTPGLRRTLMVLGRAGAPTGTAGGRALGWGGRVGRGARHLGWWRSVCRHLRVPANGRDRWLGQEGSIQIVVVP